MFGSHADDALVESTLIMHDIHPGGTDVLLR